MDNVFDVLILGGGASGVTAAITAKRINKKLKIGIIEKNSMLCRKLLVCGAGRCNLTNKNLSISRYSGANDRFLSTVFKRISPAMVFEFISSLGIEIYEEIKGTNSKGKIFPVTDDAKTVTSLISHEVDSLGIETILNTEIRKVEKVVENFVVETSSGIYESKKLVVCMGGLSYPNLGATSFGFEIAKEFGHTIVEPVPSAVPIEVDSWFCKKLSGLKMDAGVKVISNGEVLTQSIDDIMFTSYGLSGTAILDVSRIVSEKINRNKELNITISINFFGNKNFDQVFEILENRWKLKPKDKLGYSLYGLLPNKFVDLYLDYLRINPALSNSELSKETKREIVKNLINFEVKSTGTRGWEQAEFTAGGVKVSEISPDTLESKILQNLYIGGEMLDVDGDVGGFNLSWAWMTGMLIGNSVV